MIPHFNSAARGLFRSTKHREIFLRRLAIRTELEGGPPASHLSPLPVDMRDVAREMISGMSYGKPLPYWVNN